MITQTVSSTATAAILGFRQVLNRGQHPDFEVLQWSKLVEILECTMNVRQNNPQLNVCTSLADSHSASQETIAREIEGRSSWGA